tara:strand:- start:1642 stop:1890 length:249 start_codon:yes stop_codon:yes gene_type:complete
MTNSKAMNIRVFTELRINNMSDQEKNAFLESNEYITFCSRKFYEQLTTINELRKSKKLSLQIDHPDEEDDKYTFSSRYRCHA